MRFGHSFPLRYARSIVGAGVSVVEEQGCTQPRTTVNTIYIPPYDGMWDWGSRDSLQWFYYLIHESFHHTVKGDFDYLERVHKKSPVAGYIHNLVSDHNIEHLNSGDLKGRDKLVDDARGVFTSEMFNKGTGDTKGEDAGRSLGAALYLYDAFVRCNWMRSQVTLPIDKWISELGAVDIFNKLMGEYGLEPEWLRTKTPEENYQLTLRVYDLLKDESKEAEAEFDAKQAAMKEAGEGGDGEFVGSREYTIHKHGSEKGGEGKYMIGEAPEGSGEVGKPGGAGVSGVGDWEYRDVVYKVVNSESAGNSYYQEALSQYAGDTISSNIRKYLMSKLRDGVVQGKRMGKVSPKNLWRAYALRGTSSEGRVFRQNVLRAGKNTVATVLIDHSSSMLGGRETQAILSGAMLNDVFGKLRIPTAILGFTDERRTERTLILQHKAFDQHMTTDTLMQKLGTGYNSAYCNPDGEAILYAAEQISQRPEAKKVLIVVSDGSPSACRHGDTLAHTKQVVSRIENDTSIILIGVGMMYYGVEDLYRTSRVVGRASELSTVLVDLLKKEVLGA